jgi:hypothetical protein
VVPVRLPRHPIRLARLDDAAVPDMLQQDCREVHGASVKEKSDVPQAQSHAEKLYQHLSTLEQLRKSARADEDINLVHQMNPQVVSRLHIQEQVKVVSGIDAHM